MATWPTSLPAPLAAGYDLETSDPTIRTSMEAGAARVRRRNTAAPDHVSLKFLFGEAQMATFRSFWESTSGFASGAGWVFMTLRTGRAAGSVSRECRPMSGVFHAVPLSPALWAVDFKVELRNA